MGNDILLRELTTEDTKEILHKGHGGVYNYGMGME